MKRNERKDPFWGGGKGKFGMHDGIIVFPGEDYKKIRLG